MTVPVSTAEMTISLPKRSLAVDTIYVRYYEKWAADYSSATSNHNGVIVQGGTVTAGQPVNPDGTQGFVFLLQNNPQGVTGELKPGYDHTYVYWPHMRTVYGDHWFPNGMVDGSKGDWLLYPTQYPDFKAMPLHQPQRDRWYCYEIMVHLNTIGKNDGEVKWWCDGQLIADFP